MQSRPGGATIRRTMGASYAIVWREPEGTTCTGSVEASADALRFRGAAAGRAVEREVRFDAVTGVRTLRTGGDLIDGRTTLLLEFGPHETVRVAAVAGVGALAELAAILSDRLPRH